MEPCDAPSLAGRCSVRGRSITDSWPLAPEAVNASRALDRNIVSLCDVVKVQQKAKAKSKLDTLTERDGAALDRSHISEVTSDDSTNINYSVYRAPRHLLRFELPVLQSEDVPTVDRVADITQVFASNLQGTDLICIGS